MNDHKPLSGWELLHSGITAVLTVLVAVHTHPLVYLATAVFVARFCYVAWRLYQKRGEQLHC